MASVNASTVASAVHGCAEDEDGSEEEWLHQLAQGSLNCGVDVITSSCKVIGLISCYRTMVAAITISFCVSLPGQSHGLHVLRGQHSDHVLFPRSHAASWRAGGEHDKAKLLGDEGRVSRR